MKSQGDFGESWGCRIIEDEGLMGEYREIMHKNNKSAVLYMGAADCIGMVYYRRGYFTIIFLPLIIFIPGRGDFND